MKNTTTTRKTAKRRYIKQRLLTQDELWKAIIPTLWAPFLRFCLEDWVDSIDFMRRPIFLDKELKRLMLRSKSRNRAVDFLMRIYMKDGTSKCFLLHVEVQGYKDPDFPQRIFQYYYRIGDLLNEDIETLVIMIDDDPDWRPDEYIKKFGQTKVHFTFRLFKLLDNPPPYLDKKDNPFSIVFEVAWYGLERNMLKNDEDLKALKFRLIKQLLTNDVDSETIYALLDFINIYLPFKNKEKELTFDLEIESFIDKEKNMGTLTMRDIYERKVRQDVEREFDKANKAAIRAAQKADKKAKMQLEAMEQQRQEEARMRQEEARMRQEEARMRQEEARMRQEEARMRQEEARMRQEAEQRLAALVRKLHKQGESIESIAETMEQPIAFVQNIIDGK